MASRVYKLDFVNKRLHSRAKPILYVVNGDCWDCVSHVIDGGYPRIRFSNRLWKMSRLVYEMYNGKEIEKGLHILHSCDNPKCINPSHLREGTDRDNMDDMIERNRRPILLGETTSNNKLTEEQAKFIREDGSHTMLELSRMFGVSKSAVKNIKSGRTWSWIEGEINRDMIGGFGNGKSSLSARTNERK